MSRITISLLALSLALVSSCARKSDKQANTENRIIPLLNLPVKAKKLELVKLPDGTFWMGSPFYEQDRQMTETPQTMVTISQVFWMSQCEITQAQW